MTCSKTTPTPAPTPDRNDLAALALPWARRMAARHSRGNREMREELEDAAILAVARGLNRATPPRDWPRYVLRSIRRAIATASRAYLSRVKATPHLCPIDDDFDAAAPERPTELGDDSRRVLPRPLLDAVRLYYVEGLTLREAGKRLGISGKQVHNRLTAAAARLGRQLPPRTRANRNRRG
jgi:RNA polymerase sigma factor (sigma-70 family)